MKSERDGFLLVRQSWQLLTYAQDSLPSDAAQLKLRVPQLSSLCSGAAKTASTGPDLANLRENYISAGIDETALPSQPHVLMAKWLEEACNCSEVNMIRMYVLHLNRTETPV